MRSTREDEMRNTLLAMILTTGLLGLSAGQATAQGTRIGPREEARRYEQMLRTQDRIQRGTYVPVHGPYVAPAYAVPVAPGLYAPGRYTGTWTATPYGVYFDSFGYYGPGVNHPGFGRYLNSYGPAWASPYAW